MGGGIKPRKILWVSVLFILCITYGYATMQRVLEIRGYSSIDENIGMIFTNITISKNQGELAMIETPPSIKAKTLVNTKVSFDSPGELLLTVTGENHGKYDVLLKEIQNLNQGDTCIMTEVINHPTGDIVEHGETRTFDIKITSTCTSLTTKELNVFFKYEKLKVQNGMILEEDRKETFLEQARSIVSIMNETHKTDVTRKEYNFPNSTFDVNLSEVGGGYSTIDEDGDSAIAVYDVKNKWCAVKTKAETELRVIDNYLKCDQDIAENLVINGYGEYGDNTNFQHFTYQNGEFMAVAPANTSSSFSTDNFIKINSDYRYTFSVDAKTNNQDGFNYSGCFEYDRDKKYIDSSNHMYISNTLTELTKDLNDGDTVVYLKDISQFLESSLTYQNGFIFWNYKDSTGYLYPPNTYSKNAYTNLFQSKDLDKINHTITLTDPWHYGTIPHGTKLSQSNSGCANYCLIDARKLPLDYTHYQGTVTGNITNGNRVYDKFAQGTQYIKYIILPNWYNKNTEATVHVKNIVIKKVA